MKEYLKCKACGFIMNKEGAPDLCPACGIPSKIFEDYKVKKIITEGMIPKLDNGFNALTQGVKKVIITNAQMLGHANSGTILTL